LILDASAEGNMVISLDGSNPTQLLLRAIERAEISSTRRSAPTFREDEQFALAALTPAGDVSWKTIRFTNLSFSFFG
jgi:hypothetical protein